MIMIEALQLGFSAPSEATRSVGAAGSDVGNAPPGGNNASRKMPRHALKWQTLEGNLTMRIGVADVDIAEERPFTLVFIVMQKTNAAA